MRKRIPLFDNIPHLGSTLCSPCMPLLTIGVFNKFIRL
jgi:hypothetical protein